MTVDNCPVTFDFESIMHKAMGVKQVNNSNSKITMNQSNNAVKKEEQKHNSNNMVEVENEEEERKSTNTTTNGSPMKHKPSFVGRRQRRKGPGGFKKKEKIGGDDKKKNRKSPKKQPSWKQSKFTQEVDALDMTNTDGDATEEEMEYQQRVKEMREKWKVEKGMIIGSKGMRIR